MSSILVMKTNQILIDEAQASSKQMDPEDATMPLNFYFFYSKTVFYCSADLKMVGKVL